MITWMQKQRKYLIVVLWITVISFVGAGFVGWGSYSYGSKASNVATVGNIDISIAKFQKKYSGIFSYYNEILQGNVSDEQKQQLQNLTLQSLINDALLLNYANELDLSVSENEIAAEIVKTPAFMANGAFSKDLYISTITRMGYKISEYEEAVKEDLIVARVKQMFELSPTPFEIEAFSAFFRIKDRLEYKILDAADIKITPTREQKLKFYEQHKGNFLSQSTFDISYIKVQANQMSVSDDELKDHYEKNADAFLKDGKQLAFEDAKPAVKEAVQKNAARREALVRSVEWKKEKIKPLIAKGVALDNEFVPLEALKDADERASLSINKPVETKDGYVIFKIDKKLPPKQLAFNEVEQILTQSVAQDLSMQALTDEAKRQQNNFTGQQTDFISIADTAKITGLAPQLANEFLKTVFTSKQKSGLVNLDKKIVLYKILDQKIFALDAAQRKEAEQIFANVKNESLLASLLQDLQARYKIQTY